MDGKDYLVARVYSIRDEFQNLSLQN